MYEFFLHVPEFYLADMYAFYVAYVYPGFISFALKIGETPTAILTEIRTPMSCIRGD